MGVNNFTNLVVTEEEKNANNNSTNVLVGNSFINLVAKEMKIDLTTRKMISEGS